jgi:hypothetical protein
MTCTTPWRRSRSRAEVGPDTGVLPLAHCEALRSLGGSGDDDRDREEEPEHWGAASSWSS